MIPFHEPNVYLASSVRHIAKQNHILDALACLRATTQYIWQFYVTTDIIKNTHTALSKRYLLRLNVESKTETALEQTDPLPRSWLAVEPQAPAEPRSFGSANATAGKQ